MGRVTVAFTLRTAASASIIFTMTTWRYGLVVPNKYVVVMARAPLQHWHCAYDHSLACRQRWVGEHWGGRIDGIVDILMV